ncbi:MAG: hypothetical protein AAFQ98_03385 [Bacteroidota bacterium]
MTSTLYSRFSKAILATLFLGGVAACDPEPVDPEPPIVEEEDTTFSILSFIGDFAYLNTTEDVTTGTVSVVGQGLELNTFGVSAQHEEYYYIWDSQELLVVQYKAEGDTFTKEDQIAVASLLPDGRPRVMKITDDGNLLLNSWVDGAGEISYILITLPDFQIAKSGSVAPEAVGDFNVDGAEFTVAGDKAYLGTAYWNTDYSAYPDDLITWVYDYPSFENGTMITREGTPGNGGGYVAQCSFSDENGDVYQAPVNSAQWGYTDSDAYIYKISGGQYDDSYTFNVSEALGKDIGLWSLWYAEGGIAFAKVVVEDTQYAWGELRTTNTVTLVKIDLVNKTAEEMNIPKFNGFFLQNTTTIDGEFYIPVSYADGATNVYIIDVDGGVDDFTEGTLLDGSNVVAASVFAH